MKSASIRLSALLLVLSVFVASCSDVSPTAPASHTVQAAPADSAQLLGELWGGLRGTLLTCSPMPAASASATIGSLGGVINVGPHRLVVPPGALSGPVTITATAPSSTTNRVEFQPHGLTFARPAALTMSYANCGALARLLPKRIAYVDSQLNILEFLLSVDVLWQQKVTGRLDHFSEYAVAW
jgi:hypothetical protein